MFKFIATVTTLFLTFSAQAYRNEATDMGTIRCLQNTTFSPDVSQGAAQALLKQVGKYAYDLTVFRIDRSGARKILLQSRTRVEQEDVAIDFTNKRDRVHFRIYADEMDQSYIETPQAKLHFTCEYLNP